MAARMIKPKDLKPEQWEIIVDKLKTIGVDLESLCQGDASEIKAKVICLAPDLGDSVHEMGLMTRGETVMVRIDEKTSKTLDSWVETGYFKSRSEAAALFIREGLKIRDLELEKLNDSLREVEKAKKKLRDKARNILGKRSKS